MAITVRAYAYPADFDAVGEFLVQHYQPENRDGNWLQPAWEYMHFHPQLNREVLSRIGVWEDDRRVVAVAHYEWRLGEAFYQVAPGYEHLKPELLAYAETHLAEETDTGQGALNVYINDFDHEMEAIATAGGYRVGTAYHRPMSRFLIPRPFPAITLPPGFRLKSLAEDNNLAKVHRALWRGFDHEGEPPPEGIADRVIMTSGPHFRHDLTIVVEAPDGNFVCYCGLWYEPINRYTYVEPVATDPDYRRMGLGKAAMMEGIRRCAAEGATVAYVGSDQPFYLACGFERIYDCRPWVKTLGGG